MAEFIQKEQDIYEKRKTIADKCKGENRRATWQELEEVERLMAQSKTGYTRAWNNALEDKK